MNHIGTRELSTERLTLRRYELEDADAVFYNWANDAETAKYCSWGVCNTVEDALELITGWNAEYVRSDFYLWAIEINDLEQPIGVVRIKNYDDDALSCEFECWIGTEFTKKGYGVEAMNEIIRFMTNEVGARRVCGMCDSKNDGGAKLMVRLGMEFEGKLKKAAKYNTGIVDASMFGIVFYDEAEEADDEDDMKPKTTSTKVLGEDGVLRNQISNETMEYVGILAKLELTQEEMEATKKDMEEMLDYIDQLNELDTSDIEPMSHTFAVNNAFREDVIINGDGTEATLKNAPVERNGGFKVPKTISE